jgi:hypothetical protein
MNHSIVKSTLFLIIISLLSSFLAPACVDYAEPLGGGWYFDADSDTHPFISKTRIEGDPFIPCNVIAHVHDEQFVLVAQKPDTDCEWNDKDAKIANAANQTGNPVNFWIINIEEDKLIGPLSINEYFQQRQILGIPDDLKLDVKI